MSTRRRRLLVVVASGIVLLIIGAMGVIAYKAEQFAKALGCTPGVQERKESPDGRFVAVVFSMECGATTPFNTQLSIVKRNESFLPTQHRAFLILGGRHQLELSWTDANLLAVRVPAGAKTFKQEQPEYSVEVKYE